MVQTTEDNVKMPNQSVSKKYVVDITMPVKLHNGAASRRCSSPTSSILAAPHLSARGRQAS